jgi:hypothetical protein
MKGENGIIYIYDETAWKPIACLTKNSLKSSVSVIESKTKCYPGVVKKTPGSFAYSIDAEGEYIDTTTAGGDSTKASHDALFKIQQAKTLIDWKLDTDITNPTSVKYYGTALITDLNADWGAGDDFAMFTATLDGDGAITETDTHPSI